LRSYRSRGRWRGGRHTRPRPSTRCSSLRVLPVIVDAGSCLAHGPVNCSSWGRWI
jgi:hypothetical protein